MVRKRTRVKVPMHPTVVSPAYARWLAVELVKRADAAEGFEGGDGFVTRWEVLAELATLRQKVAVLRS